jgi:hypothetical protein
MLRSESGLIQEIGKEEQIDDGYTERRFLDSGKVL